MILDFVFHVEVFHALVNYFADLIIDENYKILSSIYFESKPGFRIFVMPSFKKLIEQ